MSILYNGKTILKRPSSLWKCLLISNLYQGMGTDHRLVENEAGGPVKERPTNSSLVQRRWRLMRALMKAEWGEVEIRAVGVRVHTTWQLCSLIGFQGAFQSRWSNSDDSRRHEAERNMSSSVSISYFEEVVPPPAPNSSSKPQRRVREGSTLWPKKRERQVLEEGTSRKRQKESRQRR
ncbi:hypothetical protein LZ32DRAFT_226664 [Colletotrichum eremochloae]|nr:hypothetical protein LZ32DRAFT_226664 [Colletotrichum eremochloae]